MFLACQKSEFSFSKSFCTIIVSFRTFLDIINEPMIIVVKPPKRAKKGDIRNILLLERLKI